MPQYVQGCSEEGLQRLREWQKSMVTQRHLPNCQVIIWRKGNICYNECAGVLRGDGTLAAEDSIFRWYSMSKPIVSAALMILFEEGKFLLKDPVYKFLGDKWKKENMSVFKSTEGENYSTVPCKTDITVKHLLTHTSGLSYGFDFKGLENQVDPIYHKLNLISINSAGEWVTPRTTLADFCDQLPAAPLMGQPGEIWKYGFNSDVVGRLIEVISGKPLDVFLEERVFKPLGMVDTGFVVPASKANRFSSLWMPFGAQRYMGPREPPRGLKWNGLQEIEDLDGGCQPGGEFHHAPPLRILSGGGGLVGTAMDYARFCSMLINGGSAGLGPRKRILSSKTIEWMTQNHLTLRGKPVELPELVAPGYTEIPSPHGVGFGLGFEVMLRPVLTEFINSPGAYRWGGAASTNFFVDPQENMFAILMTALRYRDDRVVPISALWKQVVYSCVVDEDQEERAGRAVRPRREHRDLLAADADPSPSPGLR